MTAFSPLVSTEPAFFEQTWDLSYRHALGTTVGGFLNGLKHKQLLGRSCRGCDRVLFPARSFCDRCHLTTTDWREVGHSGELTMFTIVSEAFPGMLVDPPDVLGYALLQGVDTAVVGYVRRPHPRDVRKAAAGLRSGTPVEVRFADEPLGQVTDFWFQVLGE